MACTGERRGTYRVLVERPEGNEIIWHVLGRGEVHTGFWWRDLKVMRSCGMYWGEERYIQGFGGET